MRDVNLLLQQRQRRLATPAAVEPSLQASASHLNSAVYMTYELTMLDVPSRYLFAFKRNITFRIST